MGPTNVWIILRRGYECVVEINVKTMTKILNKFINIPKRCYVFGCPAFVNLRSHERPKFGTRT